MKRSRYIAIVAGCLLTFSLQSASAGPLLDRLKERRAERMNQDDEAIFTDLGKDPDFVDSRISVQRNMAYGHDPLQQFDLYSSRQPSSSAPAIVMVHGGAWRTGDKAMSNVITNKVKRWVPEGIVFISINYRLLPETAPLQQASDVANAMAYIQQHATQLHIDPTQIVLMGHSAGAHLVSLLATDEQLQKQAQVQPWLATIALDSAAYDVPAIMSRSHYRFYDAAFGKDPAIWQQSSPLLQLEGKISPFLAICSTKRPDKPCQQAEDFVKQAKTLGSDATLLPEPMTHKEINRDLGSVSTYTTTVENFLRKQSESWLKALRHLQ